MFCQGQRGGHNARTSHLPCRHASIRTLFESILWDLVHDGVQLFGPTLQSQNRSPFERGTKTTRAVAATRRWQSSSSKLDVLRRSLTLGVFAGFATPFPKMTLYRRAYLKQPPALLPPGAGRCRVARKLLLRSISGGTETRGCGGPPPLLASLGSFR